MKIEQLKINGFGKIKNKEMELKDGINIIYGENESGKSTILKFIEAMLFGISKNKKGKNRSDFEQYKPWDDGDFSGKIRYRLENGKKYEVFREFKKKNPMLYNESGEEISKKFKVDKTKGINFFEEQIGLDETFILNTIMIRQQEVKLESFSTNSIVQKISNLVETGDDTISFEKSMEKLNKMQNETVGTQRTKQKPINIVEENIQKLLENKKSLTIYKQNAQNYGEDKQNIYEELNILQTQKDQLKQARQNFQDDQIQKIEVQFKKKIYIFVLLVLAILTVLLMMVKRFVIGLIPVALIVIDIFMMMKNNFKTPQNSKTDYDKIEKQIENIETKINELNVKSHILENERMNIDEKLEELARIEESLVEQNEIREELISLNTSFHIAKECLEEAYEEVRKNISPKFEQKLCETISNITDGKYQNILVSDETSINVEVENGAYMPVDRLSVGTVDEMYLSLRLSALSEIGKEDLPIIFDESFAYFDNQRLKNMLCYLQDKNYNNQIIIFTCSNREESLLNELKIEYHLIQLEN